MPTGYQKELGGASYINWQYDKGNIIGAVEAIDDILDEFGWWLILRVVSKSFSVEDEYGEPTESYTDKRVRAFAEPLTSESNTVKEGKFELGTLQIRFKKANFDDVQPGNRVKYREKWYSIVRVQTDDVGGELISITAYCTVMGPVSKAQRYK